MGFIISATLLPGTNRKFRFVENVSEIISRFFCHSICNALYLKIKDRRLISDYIGLISDYIRLISDYIGLISDNIERCENTELFPGIASYPLKISERPLISHAP